MKNLKKIAAVVLAASMAMSLTGCAGGKLGSKKLIENAKKYGADELKDADEFEEVFEDRDLEDGIYISVSGDDVKDVLKVDTDFGLDDFYDKTIKSATVFSVYSDDDDFIAFVCAFSFANKKDAQSYYEDCVDDLEDADDFEIDDGEENGITYTIGALDSYYCGAEGIYLSGNTVIVMYGVSSDLDDINDVFDDLSAGYDLVLPSEL